MQFIKPGTNIDFTGKRKIAYFLSACMIIISIFSVILHGGPRYGIDFAGGSLIQIKFFEPVQIDDITSGLSELNLDRASVQRFGDREDNEYLIRTDITEGYDETFSGQLQRVLKDTTNSEVEIRRIEMVGPQVGKDLREKALFAMFFALLFITIYISGRFELKWLISGGIAAALISAVYLLSVFKVSIPFLILAALIVTLILFWFLELKYAMGAIVALIHDVIITIGIFSIFDIEFTLPIIAALLTIMGYSLNDTIVVFDRIRENLRKYHKKPLEFILNRSINDTLARTILTALTTLIVVLCLLFFGGGIIHNFAFAMTIGVIIGTYSSIFVASPILLAYTSRRKKA